MLSAALKDTDWYVRTIVAETLGEAGNAGAVPALKAALRDEDSAVRNAAAKALRKLRAGGGDGRGDEE